MVKIITDTSSLLNEKDSKELNIDVMPLIVNLNGQEYRDYFGITTEEFCEIVRQKHVPKSSQPPIGEVVEAFEKADEDVLYLTIADGLSGCYASGVNAKEMAKNKDRITVMNTRTICGPQQHVVEIAANMAKVGKTLDEILQRINESLKHQNSYLIPLDFEFLKRGGRLSPLGATLGGFLKIVPVMIQSPDGKRLDKFTVARTLSDGFNKIIADLVKENVNEDYIIYVSHADNEKAANTAVEKIKEKLPNVEVRVLKLSPAFATQGGPGCIAIQYIKR